MTIIGGPHGIDVIRRMVVWGVMFPPSAFQSLPVRADSEPSRVFGIRALQKTG